MSGGKAEPRSPRKGQVEAVVGLLDGQEYRSFVNPKTTGQDVVDEIVKSLDIEEKDYFSIYFKEGNQKLFVDPDKPLKKQLTETTQEGTRWPTYQLYFGVKYYVPDPTHLREELTRYQYCLQVCQDVRENRVVYTREVVEELLVLLIQASAGDYDPVDHPPGYTNEFLKFLYPNPEALPVDFEMSMVELHKEKSGLTPERAEFQFLSIAKKLKRYGNHLFALRDKEGTSIILGVNAHGIMLWNQAQSIATYTWSEVVKISYKRSRFRLRHLAPPTPDKKKRAVIVTDYEAGEHRAAKRVWRACIDQHTFFRLREPPPRPRAFLPFRRNRYGFSGRTLEQMKTATLRTTEPGFARTWSARYNRARDVHCYDVERRNWYPGDDNWVMKPHPLPASELARGRYVPGQVIINFLLKGAASPFDRVEKQVMKFSIAKKEDGQFSVSNLGPVKQLGRRGMSTSTTPSNTLPRPSSSRQDITGTLESPSASSTPVKSPPVTQTTGFAATLPSVRTRSSSHGAVSPAPNDPSPYAVASMGRLSSREKTPPAVAPKPSGNAQYAKVNKASRRKSSSPPTSPPPPPPVQPDSPSPNLPLSPTRAVVEEMFEIMDNSKVESGMDLDLDIEFPLLDVEEPSQPSNTITVTTKKVAPPPPVRGQASSAATAAIAVKVNSAAARPPPPMEENPPSPVRNKTDVAEPEAEGEDDLLPEVNQLDELLREVSAYSEQETTMEGSYSLQDQPSHDSEMEAAVVREFLRREGSRTEYMPEPPML